MADNLAYVNPKNSLKKQDKYLKLINAIKEKIITLENYQSLRSGNSIDAELILMVCNCVENCVKKKASIDKKKMVLEVLISVFNGLNPQEVTHVESQCQYNFDNELIEKIPIILKTGKALFNYLQKTVKISSIIVQQVLQHYFNKFVVYVVAHYGIHLAPIIVLLVL